MRAIKGWATIRLISLGMIAGLVVLVGCSDLNSAGSPGATDNGEVARKHAQSTAHGATSESLRIAFGSCADDDAPEHPVWDGLASVNADLVLMLGDNVYADTPEFKETPTKALMRAEYAKLAASPGFARLRSSTPMFAAWDDHDFGRNDGGAEFAFKEEAAEVFMEFWEYPADDPARNRSGIYTERRITKAGLDVQIIILDTRTFRSELHDASRSLACPLKNYEKNNTGTFLGEAQWGWLAERLGQPADLRILVSSQQVIADQHCFEKWGNFPNERLRLFDLIRRSGVRNLVLLSGDRHLGEISRLPADYPGGTGFDLYEVTTSPLSARSGFGWGEVNDYRVNDDNLRESQFGLLDILPKTESTGVGGAEIAVSMKLLDADAQVRFDAQHSFALDNTSP